MLDQNALAAMDKAARAKLQIVVNYTKTSTGENVVHTGGIQEINGNILWLWDTTLNDNIRKFYISNINSLEVLDIPFFPQGGYPIKINGEILGY